MHPIPYPIYIALHWEEDFLQGFRFSEYLLVTEGRDFESWVLCKYGHNSTVSHRLQCTLVLAPTIH